MTPISVITPTVRPEGLAMLYECLQKQTRTDWEWLISLPQEMADGKVPKSDKIRLLVDPPKKENAVYNFNAAVNNLVAHAEHELVVIAVDWSWWGPTTLAQFAATFSEYPNDAVTAVVNHFRWRPTCGWGKPMVLWQEDTRLRVPTGAGGEIDPVMMEFALTSFPKSKFLSVGGLDESYDYVAANSEKDLSLRMAKAGMTLRLGTAIECRSWTHPRPHTTKQWDEAYTKSVEIFTEHRKQIEEGARLVIDNSARFGMPTCS